MVSFQKLVNFHAQAQYSQSMICNTLSAIETNKIGPWLFTVKKLAWSDTGSMAPVGSGGPEGKLKVWHSGRIERCTGLSEATCSILLCRGESQIKLQIVPSFRMYFLIITFVSLCIFWHNTIASNNGAVYNHFWHSCINLTANEVLQI